MQKLVLVDEFDREYKRLQRPAAAVAKTDHSLRLSDTLRNSSLADDRKVRQYVGELHRYLNVDNRAPVQHAKINWLTEPDPATPHRSPPPPPLLVTPSPLSSTQPVRKKKKVKRKTQPARLQWAQYGPQR